MLSLALLDVSPVRRDRGVSPVIGVVLMVAITIVLAAAIGTMVFGMTPNESTSPVASVSIEGESGTDRVLLVHEGGETLELEDYTLLVDGVSSDGNESMSGTLRSGEQREIETAVGDREAEVRLRHDPSGELLAEETIVIE